MHNKTYSFSTSTETFPKLLSLWPARKIDRSYRSLALIKRITSFETRVKSIAILLTVSMRQVPSHLMRRTCMLVYITIIPWARVGYEVIKQPTSVWRELVIITSYPTRANGINVLVNSQTGFCRRFLFPQFYKASGKSIQLLVTRAPTPAITWLLHNKKLNESDSYANDNLWSTCGENQARII